VNGWPHDKICTDYFDIIEYLLNFSGHGNLILGNIKIITIKKWIAVWICEFVSVCISITFKDMIHHPVLSNVPTNITEIITW
jgi:hypothetical protein